MRLCLILLLAGAVGCSASSGSGGTGGGTTSTGGGTGGTGGTGGSGPVPCTGPFTASAPIELVTNAWGNRSAWGGSATDAGMAVLSFQRMIDCGNGVTVPVSDFVRVGPGGETLSTLDIGAGAHQTLKVTGANGGWAVARGEANVSNCSASGLTLILLDAAGRQLGKGTLAGTNTGNPSLPLWAAGPKRYGVFYSNLFSVNFVSFSQTGALASTAVILSTSMAQTHAPPAITYTGTEFWAAWDHAPTMASIDPILVRVGDNGQPIGAPVTGITTHSVRAFFELAGERRLLTATNNELFYSVLAADGSATQKDLPLTALPAGFTLYRLVWTGADFGLTLRETSSQKMFARRLAVDGGLGPALEVNANTSYSDDFIWTGREFVYLQRANTGSLIPTMRYVGNCR